jgi:hypothetical protein
LPSLFTISGYKVYFWSNENNEPIHIHVAVGNPSPTDTKIWISRAGGCILAHNKSRIPARELSEIMNVISAQFFLICKEWKKHFLTDSINFYC